MIQNAMKVKLIRDKSKTYTLISLLCYQRGANHAYLISRGAEIITFLTNMAAVIVCLPLILVLYIFQCRFPSELWTQRSLIPKRALYYPLEVCIMKYGIALWEYLGRNTSGLSLNRANRKKHTKILV